MRTRRFPKYAPLRYKVRFVLLQPVCFVLGHKFQKDLFYDGYLCDRCVCLPSFRGRWRNKVRAYVRDQARFDLEDEISYQQKMKRKRKSP